MSAFVHLVAALVLLVVSSGCITRAGMNRDCRWPPESPRNLDLSNPADGRHLVIDAELIEELVDRYRFHPGGDQQECRAQLTDAVAGLHGVGAGEVQEARERVSDRGLNLAVNIPVGLVFVFGVLRLRSAIARRFEDEPLAASITLIVASVVLSGLLVVVGELWTSILQMIRVGSQHVGGRVAQLAWRQHEREIFLMALCVFWAVVLGQSLFGRGDIARSLARKSI